MNQSSIIKISFSFPKISVSPNWGFNSSGEYHRKPFTWQGCLIQLYKCEDELGSQLLYFSLSIVYFGEWELLSTSPTTFFWVRNKFPQIRLQGRTTKTTINLHSNISKFRRQPAIFVPTTHTRRISKYKLYRTMPYIYRRRWIELRLVHTYTKAVKMAQ